VRDPATDTRTQAALAEARRHLGFANRLGLLEPRFEEDETDRRIRSHLQTALTFDSARVPYERRWTDDEREYLQRVLAEKDTVAPRKGRPSTKRRDSWIVQVVARLVAAHGLTAMRNRSPAPDSKPQRQPTACELVAQVLDELGICLKKASVEAIWSRRPDDVADWLSVEANL
jgi:hypothetical protein